MKFYPDSCFLARYFLEPEILKEPLSVLKKQRGPDGRLPVFWLHRFEVSNAFYLYAFQSKQCSGPRISLEWAGVARNLFLEAMETNQAALNAVTLPPAVLWRQYEELSQRHTAKRGFRTYDLLHVSAALVLGCKAFWSFDTKACDLARREGLSVLRFP